MQIAKRAGTEDTAKLIHFVYSIPSYLIDVMSQFAAELFMFLAWHENYGFSSGIWSREVRKWEVMMGSNENWYEEDEKDSQYHCFFSCDIKRVGRWIFVQNEFLIDEARRVLWPTDENEIVFIFSLFLCFLM